MTKAFRVSLEEILEFVFPNTLQHPMSAARLVIYGMYGPLENGTLRSGRLGRHVLSNWEIDSMCGQIDREDILNIYLHKNQTFYTLSRSEQDALINQADTAFKCGKGHAMLPQPTKDEVVNLFSVLHTILYLP